MTEYQNLYISDAMGADQFAIQVEAIVADRVRFVAHLLIPCLMYKWLAEARSTLLLQYSNDIVQEDLCANQGYWLKT